MSGFTSNTHLYNLTLQQSCYGKITECFYTSDCDKSKKDKDTLHSGKDCRVKCAGFEIQHMFWGKTSSVKTTCEKWQSKNTFAEKIQKDKRKKSKYSLHWSISLSFCSFLYNGVCYGGLKLSVYDVIVSQKSSNGDRKLYFLGRDYKYVLDTKEQSVRDKKFPQRFKILLKMS